jgi:hypothetical protein
MKAWGKTYPENKHVKFVADGSGQIFSFSKKISNPSFSISLLCSPIPSSHGDFGSSRLFFLL